MVNDLLVSARAGDVRALGKLLTLVTADPNIICEFELEPKSKTIGITGSPGVGKSTLTSALIAQLVADGKKVAVLAVDPSSPITGGALLGDRIRMQTHATNPNVYIRSVSAGGHLGGLAKSASAQIKLLSSLYFDYVLIETVGVGQNEVEIASVAQTVLVVVAPGMGDAIQAAKAGVFEIADIFVVNKSDRDGADGTVSEINAMLEMSSMAHKPPVVKTISTTGVGVADLLNTISAL